MPCDDAKKILENTVSYNTGHFWDGNPNGWPTINPFLFWDPLFTLGAPNGEILPASIFG